MIMQQLYHIVAVYRQLMYGVVDVPIHRAKWDIAKNVINHIQKPKKKIDLFVFFFLNKIIY